MLVIVDLLSMMATLFVSVFTTEWIRRRNRRCAWLYALTLWVAFLAILMISDLEPPSEILTTDQFDGSLELTLAFGLWALLWGSLGAFYTALRK